MYGFFVAHIFTFAWIGWLLYFGIVEFLAVRRKEHGDTLSEHFWMIFGIRIDKRGGKHVVWRRMFAVAGWSILTIHLFTGWI